MKKILFTLVMLWGIAQAQTTGYFRYDSVRFEKVGGNSEFILLNASRGLTGGVLTNMGNGRTAFTNISAGLSKFRRSLEVVADSLQLDNDEADPTDTSYYGKLGSKGWFAAALNDVSDNAVGGLSYWTGGRLFRIGDSLTWSSSGLNNKYRYLINTTQVLWMPDQTNFLNTLYVGNGGTSLSHTTGVTGQYNTIVGLNSGTGMTTGYGNVGVGSRVMQTLTTGNQNTGVGEGAMQSLSTGVHNTSMGSQTLAAVAAGSYNVAIGSTTQVSASGNYNVSMGYTSMNDLLSGGMNTGIGYQSLFYNRTGNRNTAHGFASLKGATTQSFTSATAVGDSAGAANNGNKSTYIGSLAGWDHTTGAGSLFIGNDIQSPAPTEAGVLNIKNLIFGRGATGTGTTSAGNVGIGVPLPLAKLEVGGTLKINSVATASLGDSTLHIKNGIVTMGPDVTGGITSLTPELNTTPLTTNFTITEPTDHRAKTYLVNPLGGAVLASPPVSATNGQIIIIYRMGNAGGTVTVNTNVGNIVLSTENTSVTLQWSDTFFNYIVIASS